MTREEIKEILKQATGKETKIEHPPDARFGDYSTNLAIQERLNPQEIVAKVKDNPLFEKVEAKAGFVNFFLSKEYLQRQVGEVLSKKEKYGSLDVGRGKKVQVEFVSANPTGPLTVGNARGGPFGDVLANVLKVAGFKVERAYYVNDCGRQIEALGHSVLKDAEAIYKGKYIDELSKLIKEKNAMAAGQKAAGIIIEKYIKKTLEKANIKYDEWYFESKLVKYTDKALKDIKKFIYEKDGAQWFKASQFGDERDRVVVKSDGDRTYLAGDLGLHKYKFEKFDKVINIWGADHFGDVAGLMGGVEALGHKGKLEIILLQFVSLLKKGEKVKMSKRKGNVVELRELLDEVGSDAVRFFFLQRSADTHLTFDLDLAKEQSEKNPVFYVQYAHARICSILAKLQITNYKFKIAIQNLKLLNHSSELKLIKQLIRLPEVVEDTARDYQVQRLPGYAQELATSFHQFYTECRVLDDNNKELTGVRLALVMASKIVFKNTLDLMGISAPEKM